MSPGPPRNTFDMLTEKVFEKKRISGGECSTEIDAGADIWTL